VIKGWKKLNKKELRHLKDKGLNHTFCFQNAVNYMEEWRALQREKYGKVQCEPCWECKFIAQKLAIEPTDVKKTPEIRNGGVK
jgi:hypothetical protein